MFFSYENYSVFHNYNYEDKSNFVKCLDVASSPVRELLGGKTVCLINEKSETSKLNLFLTVSALALLTFASLKVGGAVIAISLASFALKVLFVKYSSENQKINTKFDQIVVRKEFDCAVNTKDYLNIIGLYNDHAFLHNQLNSNVYSQAVRSARQINSFFQANLRRDFDAIITLYEDHLCISEQPENNGVYRKAKAMKSFKEANNTKNYNKIIELYKTDPGTISDEVGVQDSYADAIITQFCKNKELRLIDSGRLVFLIDNHNLRLDTTSRLVFEYMRCADIKRYFSGGVDYLFEVILRLQPSSFEPYCMAILKKCAINNVIDMGSASQEQLFQVLVIDETISILEKIPNRKTEERELYFKNVKNFEQNKVSDIKSFLMTLSDLYRRISELEALVNEKKSGPFREFGFHLADVAEKMKFTKKTISDLLENMNTLLKEKISQTKEQIEIKSLEETICMQLETLSEAHSNPPKEEKFVLATYYKQEHPRLIKGLNSIKNLIFSLNKRPDTIVD